MYYHQNKLQLMLKRNSLIGLCIIVFACQAQPNFNQDVSGSKNLKAESYHGTVGRQIAELIENYTYKKTPLNDSISGLIYERYIKAFDSNKTYFFQTDIEEFEQGKFWLDDALKNNDLSFAYYVFNVFQKRYINSLKYSLTVINQPFKFDKLDTFFYNREKLAWFKNEQEMQHWWKKRVNYDLLNLKLAGSDSTKSVATLKKRYEDLIAQSEKLNNQDVFQIFMNAFTESVDPHTNYFNPANAANFNIEQSRTLEGIGATLTIESEMITIASIVVGGPADKSKLLHVKDRIIGVAQGKDGDFTDIIGWRLDNAIQLIRGPKGTTVKLKILPSGEASTAEPKIIEIVRDKIVLKDQLAKKKVKTIKQEGKTVKIGIIDIPAFYMNFKDYQAGDPNYQSTTRDVRMLIDSLKNEKIDALVIDLRSNGGGSLLEAIDLTGLFIKTGPVVQVRDMQNNVQVNMDQNPSVAWDGPLTVIVDRFSASASEIFAGAIQDWGRGIIIGTQTYGKGTVQTAINMQKLLPALGEKSGQINLTMAKFYRICGGSTQHKGVMPNIQFPMIYSADKYGESAQPSALPWDEIKPCNYVQINNLSLISADLKNKHEQRMKKSADYQFMLEDIKDNNKQEKEVSIILSEEKLKKQRDDDAEKTLDRNNRRRKARGLKPLKKGESKPTGEEDYDFIEDESLKITADLINIVKK